MSARQAKHGIIPKLLLNHNQTNINITVSKYNLTYAYYQIIVYNLFFRVINDTNIVALPLDSIVRFYEYSSTN